MSDYLEALRAELEPTLRCPKCRQSNVEGATPSVTLIDVRTATCSICGYDGFLGDFQKEQ